MEYTNQNTPVGLKNQLLEPLLQFPSSSKNTTKAQKNNNNLQKIQKNNFNNILIDDLPNAEDITNLHITNQDNKYLIDYMKIGIINIQEGYKNKLTNILNYFITHNFNILGITETQYELPHPTNNLVERYPHPTNKNSFIYIILDANRDNKGSGVGIILTDTLYKYVHKIKFFKGRILHIQLGFKKQQSINITCLYLSADHSKKSDHIKKECNNFIDSLSLSPSNNHTKQRTYDIIMGNFNCYPKNKTNLNYYIIQLAKSIGLKDMAKYHAINNSSEPTRMVHRIDCIFGNVNIIDASIHTFTQPVPLSFFNTDHKSVITLLQNDFLILQQTHNRFNKNKTKLKPDYAQMNDETWETYKSNSKLYFKNCFRFIDFTTIKSKEDLDHIWNIFEHSIQHIKKQNISHKHINPNQQRHLYPLHIRQLNNHVISIYKTKQFFNLKHIYIRHRLPKPDNKEDLIPNIPDTIWNEYFKNWSKYHAFIIKITLSIELNILLQHTVTKENYHSQKTIIYDLYKQLKFIRDDTISKWRVDERIDYYINQRNNDLSANQTKMINSILQRTPRRITLDRLVFQDDSNNTIFTNNPKLSNMKLLTITKI